MYSRAWLDLSKGPVTVQMDRQPVGRYWSVSFLDASHRIFALRGQRMNDQGPVKMTLVGPQHDASITDGEVVKAPGHDVWLFARWLVEGEQDVPEARAMQDRLSIHAPSSATPCAVMPTHSMDPENFLSVVAEQLQRNPASGVDAQWIERLAFVGIQAGTSAPWKQLPGEVRDAWIGNIKSCHQRLRKTFMDGRLRVNGWWAAEDHPGEDASAYEWRAGVALVALGGLDSREAVYAARMTDDAGNPLHGRHLYRMTVPPSGIPVDAFWSMSLYELMPNGDRFFADNPIARYSIGDRTPGLQYESDGSLVITLQRGIPADTELHANWLPVPAAPFALTLRAYHPREDLRRWQVPLPKLECVG